MKRALVLLMLLPLLAFGQRSKTAQRTQAKQPEVRNVIFIVGDGMGVAQVYTSVVAQQANRSAFIRFPYSGFSRTFSYDRYTTDSGAGGSALVTGHKIENYHIALGPDGTPYPSFLTYAKRFFGMAAGFVVTSSVLDATPASTYAHVTHRKLFDSISMQMAQCDFDVMVGGGLNNFKSENRKDGLSPLDTLRSRGYAMAYNTMDLMALRSRRICGLLYPSDPPRANERGRMLTLGTLKAIEMLNQSDNGFTLLVEGSQIDWACHRNDSAYLVAELADFEDMLNAVLDFAQQDGRTLVVVTADHETGGLTLLDGNITTGETRPKWVTGGHSGIMVPVFAYGPGAERFTGIMQNTDIYYKIMDLMAKGR